MASHQRLVERLRRVLIWPIRQWELVVLLAVLLLSLTTESPPPSNLDTQINRLLVGERFDFMGWEVEAVLSKLAHTLVAPQRYMDESARHDFLLGYLEVIADIQQVEWEIHHIYADPEVEVPEAKSVELRARLEKLRMEEEARQPLAEAILEEQIACILVNEGFGLLGQEIPPVSVRFTPLPALLIVSPRDRIERIFSLGLRHGLDAAQREAIEAQVDTTHAVVPPARPSGSAELVKAPPEPELDGVSSLVTGIGGLSAYPAMLLESRSLNWIAEVTAHEWTHHYLAPRPLGWNYDATPETRTINETVASIVGKEAGRRMVARYYPEHLPPEPEPKQPDGEPEEEPLPSEPPAFDFRVEMRETRIQVDELLAEGKIEEAEVYMEERRQEFVANGYHIRKLNQAYFAFHGAYADEPGAAGTDPIGPAVQELRAVSPDLYTFVARIAPVTTLAELEVLLAETE